MGRNELISGYGDDDQVTDNRRKQSPEGLYKKGFLKKLQTSEENTCARVSFLIKLQASGLQLY